jgi:hypothetical protein
LNLWTCTRRWKGTTQPPAEIRVGMPRGCEPPKFRLHERVPVRHLPPHRPILGHLIYERMDPSVPSLGFDAEPLCKTQPEPEPSEDVAIDDIEGNLVRRLSLGRLDRMLRKHMCIGHVGEAAPLRLRARPPEDPDISFSTST